jgi:hypothetical protein
MLVFPLVGRRLACPPIVLISAALATVGVLGAVAFSWLNLPHLPIENKLFLVPLDTTRTLIIFFTAATMLLLGAAFAILLSPRKEEHRLAQERISATAAKGILATPSWALTLVAIVPLAIYVLGRGPTTLWHASRYLEITGVEALVKLGFAGIPLGMLSASFLSAQGRSVVSRIFAFVLIFLYAVVAIAAATRALALLPLSYYMMVRLSATKQRRQTVLVVCALLTVMGLSLPVHLRGLAEHGLAPYTQDILSNPTILVAIDLPTVVSNVLIAFPLCNYVSALELPPGSLAASINPLPGSYTGWDSLLNSLRVNYYVPYSAIGESAAHGGFFFGTYYLIAGAIFATAWISAGYMHAWRPWVARIATLGLSGLFAVQTLQYNLRTVTRLEYYLVAFMILFKVADLILESRTSRTSIKSELARN